MGILSSLAAEKIRRFETGTAQRNHFYALNAQSLQAFPIKVVINKHANALRALGHRSSFFRQSKI